MKMKLLERVKWMLGQVNYTEFEKALISAVMAELSPADRAILSDQLARMTRVERSFADDLRMRYGYTELYCMRGGRAINNAFPLRFQTATMESELARVLVWDGDNSIEARLMLVNGGLFQIQYYSPSRVWYPRSGYRIQSVTLCLDKQTPAQSTADER